MNFVLADSNQAEQLFMLEFCQAGEGRSGLVGSAPRTAPKDVLASCWHLDLVAQLHAEKTSLPSTDELSPVDSTTYYKRKMTPEKASSSEAATAKNMSSPTDG